MIDHFDAINSWAATNNVPVYLGEFGAYSKADIDSRERWTAFVAREAERRNFSWAYWEFCSGFGAYDSVGKKWNEQLLRALLPQN